MNILLVVPGGVDPSGVKNVIPVILTLINKLSQNHQVCVIALAQHEQYQEYRLEGADIISLPSYLVSQYLFASYTVVKTLKRMSFSPDVIHSFWLGTPTLLAAILAARFRKPLLSSVAGGELVNFPLINYGGARTKRGHMLNFLTTKLADYYTVGSQYLYTQIDQQFSKPMDIVPLGINLDYWDLKNKTQASDKITILHIASINRVKNFELLLAIASMLLKNAHAFSVTCIGMDTLNGEVQQLAKKMQLNSHIHFLGFKEQSDIKPLMQNHQFILQTSHFESQGIAIAEAVSQGLCPVGTGVGWLHDMSIGVNVSNKVATNVIVDGIVDDIVAMHKNLNIRVERIRKLQAWLKNNDAIKMTATFEAIYEKLAP